MASSTYQVSSRKYRPQTFQEIVGQDSVVTVLKNALHLKRSAHAYIFSGIRGTGKTTLARLFAKALNCSNLSPSFEPCNSCASCKEISQGTALDVLEIDGASHRGIEDIRQINETVFFSPVKSEYKIYIIDEVHMLTKEAFNSLLKTLEEPPAHIKFFLATTEMHKVPATILSRCQKLHLKRIPDDLIVNKLLSIASNSEILVSREALVPIAYSAQGSLRDAESLYDYVVSLFPDTLSPEKVSEALGLASHDTLCKLAKAISEKDYAKALLPITTIIDSGVAPITFLQDLTIFYRDLLLKKDNPSLLAISSSYSDEYLLEIIDFLGESAKHLQQTIFEKTFLETVIIHLIRICHRPSINTLISQLHNHTLNEDKVSPQPRANPDPSSQVNHEQQSFLTSFAGPRPTPDTASQKITISSKESATIDTLLQFTAVEFAGVLTKE
ncbi:DNA polymerase III, subunit gamma and tau [Chlamydia ibidis]|uniref:DNA polymerase III subunit gamma/tau n=2 Tax=Chlamydia ibidis TaxID=1405396 RepID=S7J2Z8_9CHLA|nr:DNA polymerase III subunit gamma/tau [Chlamydia ibidis]EPP34402.1 DNA polymerase III, subunit gamma and tau [Chlamydia ibidis]EQM63104.1 DNA polymerase III, subunit gamma and tau [Chlamydia ibidis 10-1398/6]